jgi:uncharacterized protein with GYD domain
MATYLMLATLTPQGMRNLRATPERLHEVNREIELLGGKVVSQWALLGPYDFLTIIEAPAAVDVARIAVEVASRGSAELRTLATLPVDDLIEALEDPRSTGS